MYFSLVKFILDNLFWKNILTAITTSTTTNQLYVRRIMINVILSVKTDVQTFASAMQIHSAGFTAKISGWGRSAASFIYDYVNVRINLPIHWR